MYKQKNDFVDPTLEGKCPVCGGTEFEWGRMGRQAYYVPGESMWRFRGYKYIRTRRCVQCNNLLNFADESMTSRQNRMMLVIVAVALLIGLVVGIMPLLMMNAR